MAIAFRAAQTAATGTASPATITVPTGTATGDIIVAMVISGNNGATQPTHSFPGGWTVAGSVAASAADSAISTRISIAWHAWASGETSYSVTITNIVASNWIVQSASYSGCDTTSPIDQIDMGTPDTAHVSTAVSSNTVTSSTGGLWRLCGFSGGETAANRTWGSYSPADTERGDTPTSAATRRCALAMTDSNGSVDASGGTSVTATPSGTTYNRCGSILLLKPPAAFSSAPNPIVVNYAAHDRALAM